jgi:hypothetical protein
MKRSAWSVSSTAWRSLGASARGGVGRGTDGRVGCRWRYTDARANPKASHAAAVPSVGVAVSTPPASVVLVGHEGFQRSPQELRNFFLERDDRLRLLQATLEPMRMRFKGGLVSLDLLEPRIGRRFPSPLLRRQPGPPLLAPRHCDETQTTADDRR